MSEARTPPNPNPRNELLADADWFARRYLEDWLPIEEIAAEAGATDVSTVHLWRQRHGIEPRNAHDIDPEKLLELLEDTPIKEIARELGVDPSSIYDRLYRLGVRRVELVAPAEDIRRWYRELRSVARVAERLGVSPRAATRQLLAAGAELQPRGRRKGG